MLIARCFTYLKIFFFIYGSAGFLLLCGLFSSCNNLGLVFSCYAWASLAEEHGLSGTWCSVVAAHGLNSCGASDYLLHSIQDLPRPGIEPVSPALASGFFITEAPAKSYLSFMIIFQLARVPPLVHCLNYCSESMPHKI